MTVTEIVNDLLDFNMITIEAATVLLNAEFKANLFDDQQLKQDNAFKKTFQPYHGLSGNTSNPYYVSSTTNDPIKGTSIGLSDAAIELIKTK